MHEWGCRQKRSIGSKEYQWPWVARGHTGVLQATPGRPWCAIRIREGRQHSGCSITLRGRLGRRKVSNGMPGTEVGGLVRTAVVCLARIGIPGVECRGDGLVDRTARARGGRCCALRKKKINTHTRIRAQRLQLIIWYVRTYFHNYAYT